MKPPFLSASHTNDNIVERVITIPRTNSERIDGLATPGTTMTAIIRHIETATRELSGNNVPLENSPDGGEICKGKNHSKSDKAQRVYKPKGPPQLCRDQANLVTKGPYQTSSPELMLSESPQDNAVPNSCSANAAPETLGRFAYLADNTKDSTDVSDKHGEIIVHFPGRYDLPHSQWQDNTGFSIASVSPKYARVISRAGVQSLEATLDDPDWLGAFQAGDRRFNRDDVAGDFASPDTRHQTHNQDLLPSLGVARGDQTGKTRTISSPRTRGSKDNNPVHSKPRIPRATQKPRTLFHPRQRNRHLGSGFTSSFRKPDETTSVQLEHLRQSLAKCQLDLSTRLDRLEQKLDLALSKLGTQPDSPNSPTNTKEPISKANPADPSVREPTSITQPQTPSVTQIPNAMTNAPRRPPANRPFNKPHDNSLYGNRRKGSKLPENEKVIRSNLVGMPPHVPFGGMEGWYERVKKL